MVRTKLSLIIAITATQLMACGGKGSPGAPATAAKPAMPAFPAGQAAAARVVAPPAPVNSAVNPAGTPASPSAVANAKPPAPPPPSKHDYQAVNKDADSSANAATGATATAAPERPEDVVVNLPALPGPLSQTETPANKTPNQPNTPPAQCGPAAALAPEWLPGLPHAPAAQPMYTDFQPTPSGLRYTDARADGLMAKAVDMANAVSSGLQKASQDFAKRIHYARVLTVQSGMRVDLQIADAGGKGKFQTIFLRGKAKKGEMKLTQVLANKKAAAQYSGTLTCADADHACQNSIIQLDVHGEKNAIIETVFILHRYGPAQLTLSDEDRRRFASFPNSNYSSLAEYFSNSENNTCLSQIAEVKAGRLGLSACDLQKLQADCGGEDMKQPAARAITFRAWAVAYGHSAFEIVMARASGKKLVPQIVISGPLVYSTQHPVLSRPMRVSGDANRIQDILLMNNDGGGNLNFQIDLKGQPESHMRISVSSVLPNTI